VRYNRREKTGGQQSQVSLSAPNAAEPSTMPFAQRLTCTIDDACEVTGLGRTKLYELIGAGRSRELTRSAGTSLLSLLWTPASTRIPCDSPMDRDRLLRTPASPQNLAAAYSDSSRAGQWFNGQGYVGVSSPTYGTLTVFRQNSLTLDAVFDYDPFSASYGFSPIGFQGITCGGGNTENCRNSTSLKYRVKVSQFRAAALWQFGGYAENNASNGAYTSRQACGVRAMPKTSAAGRQRGGVQMASRRAS
jgi:hypothetical protein